MTSPQRTHPMFVTPTQTVRVIRHSSEPDERYPRCPDCHAVAHPDQPVTHRHRPPCSFTNTDPQTWSQT